MRPRAWPWKKFCSMYENDAMSIVDLSLESCSLRNQDLDQLKGVVLKFENLLWLDLGFNALYPSHALERFLLFLEERGVTVNLEHNLLDADTWNSDLDGRICRRVEEHRKRFLQKAR